VLRKTWDANAQLSLNIGAPHHIVGLQIRLRQKSCTRNIFVLHGLGCLQNRDLSRGVLFQCQANRFV